MSEILLPANYVNIENDEMEYVDGGVYLDNATIHGIVMSVIGVGAVTATSVAVIQAGIYAIAGAISTIPGFGWITGALLAANATLFAWACVNAIMGRKGVDIAIGFPTGLRFSVK